MIIKLPRQSEMPNSLDYLMSIRLGRLWDEMIYKETEAGLIIEDSAIYGTGERQIPQRISEHLAWINIFRWENEKQKTDYFKKTSRIRSLIQSLIPFN